MNLPTQAPHAGALLPRDLAWHPPALTPGYRSSLLRSPRHKPLALPGTPTELAGPVFGHDLIGPLDGDLIHNFARPGESAIGPRIIVHGRVMDEDGNGVAGALLEVWQANAGGRYRHKREGYVAALDPDFGGCGRTVTDGQGGYRFRTVRPGPYPFPNGPNDWRPAHIHFSVFGNSFAQRLITQMYFEGDPFDSSLPDRRDAGRPGRRRRPDRHVRPGGDAAHGRLRLPFRHRAARPPRHLLREPAGGRLMLKESASQTAGPYVHIGLMPNFAGLPTSSRPILART